MPYTLTHDEVAFLERIHPQLNFQRKFPLSLVHEADMKAFLSLRERSLIVEERGHMACVTVDALHALAAAQDHRKKTAEENRYRDLQQQRDDERNRKDARRSWFQFWLGLALGWILGGVSSAPLWTWLQSFLS